jgi:phosphate butyryltransferase
MEFNFSQLPELIKKTDKNTIAVVATDDEEVIQALKNASKLVTLSFIFIGNRDNVTKLIHKYQLTGEIIHEQDLTKMGEIAVQLVREQKVNLIMKGLIDTKFLLKAVVNSTIGIKKFATLSHVAIFQYPTGCTLMATDCAMNISPDVQTK